MFRTLFAFSRQLAVGSAFAVATVHAASVSVSYELNQGTASIDPFTIPNPQGGADLTVAPSLTIVSGSFEADFENAASDGTISDGAASVRNLNFNGSLSILVSTTIGTPPFSFNVTADINGPLTGTQLTDSVGSIVGNDAVYLDATPGLFDINAGPLDCDDGLAGIVCSLLEAALGITFPITLPAAANTPFPFTGAFSQLNEPGSSAVTNELNFSVPIGDTDFGTTIDFSWIETSRVLVPEPTVSALALIALLARSRRRRS